MCYLFRVIPIENTISIMDRYYFFLGTDVSGIATATDARAGGVCRPNDIVVLMVLNILILLCNTPSSRLLILS